MIRAFLYLVLLAAIVAAAAWLAERPGDVAIAWQGYRVDTSVGVLMLAALVLAVAVMVVYRLWRVLWGAPRQIARHRGERRRGRGYKALTQGMVAVAAGEADEAARHARRADALLNDPPLTMLLSAQAAQLEGDEAAAASYFKAMLERPETEFLGLRGLLMQANRNGDTGTALELARRAHQLRPRTPWVLTSLLDLQIRGGQWDEADRTLDEAIRRRVMAEAEGRRGKAIVRYQRSLDVEEAGDIEGAVEFARKGHEIEPGFVPATTRLARLLVRTGKERRAAKLIQDAWVASPHPEFVRIYAEARPAADALGWAQEIQNLVAQNPSHRESHLALAEAALAAELWGEARRHLDKLITEAPSARICRLRAELEEAEHGDTKAARLWLGRAAEAEPDPAWVCDQCGAASEAWRPVCDRCGSIDELVWRSPERVAALALTEVVDDSLALGNGAADAPEAEVEPARPAAQAAAR